MAGSRRTRASPTEDTLAKSLSTGDLSSRWANSLHIWKLQYKNPFILMPYYLRNISKKKENTFDAPYYSRWITNTDCENSKLQLRVYMYIN